MYVHVCLCVCKVLWRSEGVLGVTEGIKHLQVAHVGAGIWALVQQ